MSRLAKRRPKPLRRKRGLLPTTRDSITPIHPGKTGWSFASVEGPKTNGWWGRFKRYPSWMRVMANYDPHNFPIMSEAEAIRCLERHFKNDEDRKTVHQFEPDGPCNIKELAFVQYLKDNEIPMSHWRRHSGRAKSQFQNGREACEDLMGGGRLYPWEIAHMRIPESLANDDDVIFMQAAAQGSVPNFVKRFSIDPKIRQMDYPPQCRNDFIIRGLEKFVSDKWVRFGIAAPFMSQFGIDMGKGFTHNLARCEYLLDNPYHATEPELEIIERTAAYANGWAHASHALGMHKAHRKPPPPGGIYYPNIGGAHRARPLDWWAIWSKGKQRPGGY